MLQTLRVMVVPSVLYGSASASGCYGRYQGPSFADAVREAIQEGLSGCVSGVSN